jgi:hypothetical protein
MRGVRVVTNVGTEAEKKYGQQPTPKEYYLGVRQNNWKYLHCSVLEATTLELWNGAKAFIFEQK